MKNSVLFLFAAITVFSGCTFYRPMNVSLGNVGPNEEARCLVKGESSAFYVLWFGPFGDDSLAAALKDARIKSNTDSITNVFIDRKVFWFPIFFMKRTTVISGTAIHYTNKSFHHQHKDGSFPYEWPESDKPERIDGWIEK